MATQLSLLTTENAAVRERLERVEEETKAHEVWATKRLDAAQKQTEHIRNNFSGELKDMKKYIDDRRISIISVLFHVFELAREVVSDVFCLFLRSIGYTTVHRVTVLRATVHTRQFTATTFHSYDSSHRDSSRLDSSQPRLFTDTIFHSATALYIVASEQLNNLCARRSTTLN